MKNLLPTLLLVPFLSFAQSVPDEVLKLTEKIDTNRMKAHVAYLADDKLQGRKPGKEGYRMAVDYVMQQYKSMGLEPAGENGSYIQKVMLRNAKIKTGEANLAFILPNGTTKKLNFADEFSMYPHAEKNNVSFNAPLVFVGAGIQAPEIGFRDYENINVKGKICLVLQKTPDNVPANVRLHLRYPSTFQEYALKHGAIGVITCNYTSNAIQFKSAANAMLANGTTVSINSNGKAMPSASLQSGKIQIAGGISVSVLKELMQANGLDLEKIWKDVEAGKSVSQNLDTRATGSYQSTYNDIESYNVIGKITGSHPKLKKEYVIHSAHLDHLGIGKPINGDSIYNGAHDNASGVSAALEIARTYSALAQKPKRSILFLLVTAEEMGLLGSAYFANNPTVPKKKIVVDVNTDMPTFLAQLESIAPLGAEHSTLLNLATKAANYLNLGIETDPEPSEGRFVRSDQYSFVKAGIPALHIKFGHQNSNPNLAADVKKWRETHYHKPSDEIGNGFVWSAGRTYARLNFLISYMAAQSPERVKWNDGDFFKMRLLNSSN
jgi:Peptidase family M28